MFCILVDTRVCLDLAKDYSDQPIINALEDLFAAKQTGLIVPQVVVDEFPWQRSAFSENKNKTPRMRFQGV